MRSKYKRKETNRIKKLLVLTVDNHCNPPKSDI